jgi:hypothetical protein
MLRYRWLAPALFGSLLLTVPPVSAADKDVEAEKLYRLSLRVREADQKDFGRTVAIDVFHDKAAKRLYYVGDGGKALASVPGTARGTKEPTWLYRLTLPVRRWDDRDFVKASPRVGVEVYRDDNAGQLVYISDHGSIAVAPVGKTAPKTDRKPRSLYRLPLKVRQDDSFLEPLKCTVEVYLDENSGLLVYITAGGALAVVGAEKVAEVEKPGEAKWSHAFHLPARKPGEDDFSGDTPRFSMEVYHDGNRGAWIYIAHTLQFAVLPGKAKEIDSTKIKPPFWRFRLRPAGDDKKWSAEVYRDENVDNGFTFTPAGTLTVFPVK